MSFAKDGNSDIYTMDLETRVVERITENSAIDTSPSFSPDGKFISFNSDRSGLQQIYVMRSDGSNIKRITLKWYLWYSSLVTKRRSNCFYKNEKREILHRGYENRRLRGETFD